MELQQSQENERSDAECANMTIKPSSKPDIDDKPKYLTGVSLYLNFLALALATMISGYDANCVTTIIPVVTDTFNSLTDVGWYGAAFLLASASSQLFFGKLYRFFPAKIVFSAVMFIFAVGSLICAVAPTSNAFIVGRAVSGLGSAGILAGANIVLSRSVALRLRPIYASILGAIECLFISIGPLIGGAITDSLGWRWCFYLILPLAGLTILSAVFFFSGEEGPEESTLTLREKMNQLDVLSLFLFMPAVVCLILALQWGGSEYQWSNWRIIVLFVIFGCLLLAFVAMQWWKADDATVPPKIFLTRTVLFGSWYIFNTSGALDVFAYYLPIWFQAVKGSTPFESGIQGLPLELSMVAAVLASGAMISFLGYYTPMMCLGMVLMSIGAGLLITLKVSTSTPLWIIYQIVYALGVGLGFQTPMIATQTVFSGKDLPTALVTVSFLQTLGGVVAVSAAQNVFSNRLIANLRQVAPDVNSDLVQHTGILNLKEKFAEHQLAEIISAYNKSIVQVLVIGLAMSTLTLVACVGVPMRSVKAKPAGDEEVNAEEANEPEKESRIDHMTS